MEKEKKLRVREDERYMGKGYNYSNRSSSLCIHKESQRISKSRNNEAKIRIIHIFAPEIIKTDAGNFRELVQRLTGKPSSEKHCNPRDREQTTTATRRSSTIGPAHHKPKMELRDFNDHQSSHEPGVEVLTKQEEVGVCCNNINDDNLSGGYLGGFSDLEGFISELSQFPLDFDDHALTT